MAHDTFNFDNCLTGAFQALGVGGNLVCSRELPTDISELLLAIHGYVVVFQAHVALELRGERDVAEPESCQ